MKLLPGILLIVTGILLFVAAGLQLFSLVLIFDELFESAEWVEIVKRGLVILALGVLVFFSIKGGLGIIKRQREQH